MFDPMSNYDNWKSTDPNEERQEHFDWLERKWDYEADMADLEYGEERLSNNE